MSILNKKSFLFLLMFVSINLYSQTFSSRKASFSEKVQIMYLKGYFNFMYDPDDNLKLTLNKNNTFNYYVKSCNGNKDYKGNWELIKDTLILKIIDKKLITEHKNIIKYIKFNNSVFYKVSNVTRIADNKKMKNLTLLSLK